MAKFDDPKLEAIGNLLLRALEEYNSGEDPYEIEADFVDEFKLNLLSQFVPPVPETDTLIYCSWCTSPALGYASTEPGYGDRLTSCGGHGSDYTPDGEMFAAWLVAHDAQVRASVKPVPPAFPQCRTFDSDGKSICNHPGRYIVWGHLYEKSEKGPKCWVHLTEKAKGIMFGSPAVFDLQEFLGSVL